MARDLITKREGANAPSRPIIVQNVASLPAGAEICVNDAADAAGDVVPAGTPVFCVGNRWYAGYSENAIIKGVLVNDCVVYEDSEILTISGAIMLIGVVNADYYEGDANEYREALEGSLIVVIGKVTIG